MKRFTPAARRMRACESGATAIEFAIIAFVMIMVCIGTIEIGRGLLLRNDLAFAADFAARKVLMDSTISIEDLENVILGALTGVDPDPLVVDEGSDDPGEGEQFRTIKLSYPFTLLIPDLTSNSIRLTIARRVPIL